MFNADIAFAFLVGGVLLILLFPLPPLLLDLLLVFSISTALFVLILMFYLHDPLDFSSFPSLLLILTLYRLSLNVASTKLILLNAHAGNVIQAFGEFVVGNNYIVGAVVFVILVVIQFMVITKGAGRIAEVSARFTLDAMPGKQMSIDADLNAGIIDEDEARTRRKKLSDEAEFYGAMDGASKFVKGDAIAGLVITAINILGGLAIGIFQQQMRMLDALQTYTILTIGDGLVTQIPALVISISSGILVTKVAQSGGLGAHVSGQLLKRPEPMFISGIMMFILAVLPGLPFLPFVAMSGLACAAGMGLVKSQQGTEEMVMDGDDGAGYGQMAETTPGTKRDSETGNTAGNEKERFGLPEINPMTIEIGFGLVPLVDRKLSGDLVERTGMIRDQIREDMGFMIPPISIQDNLELDNNEYRILVRSLERARGTVQAGSRLAINPGDVSGDVEGIKTKDPTFGFDAVWISPRRVDDAESRGYTVVDCSGVIATHITSIVQRYAADLLSRQTVSDMLDIVKQDNQAVVKELIPDRLTVGVIHRVLQYLLSEEVPIHDLPVILETLSDYAERSRDPMVLCEFCRQALKGHIIGAHVDSSNQLHGLVLHPELERELTDSLTQEETGVGILGLSPQRAETILESIRKAYENALEQTETAPVLLISPPLRAHIARLAGRKPPDIAVLSYAEASDDVTLRVMGTVRCKTQNETEDEEAIAV